MSFGYVAHAGARTIGGMRQKPTTARHGRSLFGPPNALAIASSPEGPAEGEAMKREVVNTLRAQVRVLNGRLETANDRIRNLEDEIKRLRSRDQPSQSPRRSLMDPKVALENILRGFLISEHAQALMDWLACGGFAPSEMTVPNVPAHFVKMHCGRHYPGVAYSEIRVRADKAGLWTAAPERQWLCIDIWFEIASIKE